jgi:hypothetical protein
VDTQLDSLFIKRKTMSYGLLNTSANIPDWWYWMKWITSSPRTRKSCIN